MNESLLSRRSLITGAIGAATLLATGATLRVLDVAGGDDPPLRPPGIESEEHFLGTCIRCNRCRGACPRDIIVNCDMEDGLINIRTPRLSFHSKFSESYRREEGKDQAMVTSDPYPALLSATGKGFCDFCMLCALSCPTGALKTSFDPEVRWIGEAVIDPLYCIAFEKLGGCRKCADYCPFNAITINEKRQPVVDPKKCNGCGICENICPSSSYRTFKGTMRRGVNIEATTEERPL
ncbi:MAG TPA: hypothetical protein DEB24_06495 [Coriobacteriia bacterium]|nr:hypothetical protein [Coriobacteriia bacterium]